MTKNQIKVIECETENKKERTFPCLLQGINSKDYYYATSSKKGFNLTKGRVMDNGQFTINYSTSVYEEIDCLTLSL